ncbi:MAG: 16S rRNA (guanine(527)-N(7))-methyltransferase RsmG, partial [Alphaproteobacteria bacterium]|nr:16S rRNA (guanine(527)-N(7))-methyltransferase RsmG [Alphaproteobacteria bacterium]
MTNEEQFLKYENMLIEWSAKMNLVARSTLSDVRGRHTNDSVQTVDYVSENATVVDLGSGAGFPAVPLAIKGRKVFAIESIGKKCVFLCAVKDELKLDNLTIINDRIENVITRITNHQPSIIITARAFASLDKILDMTHMVAGAEYVLLKGESVVSEIAIAQKRYKFSYKVIPSITGPGFVVLL